MKSKRKRNDLVRHYKADLVLISKIFLTA